MDRAIRTHPCALSLPARNLPVPFDYVSLERDYIRSDQNNLFLGSTIHNHRGYNVTQGAIPFSGNDLNMRL